MQSNEIRWVRLGGYIKLCDEVNTKGTTYPMLGINKDKVFMPTVANVSTVDIKKYKIVSKGRFVFSGMQTGRDVCIRIALYDKDEPALISPAYTTFIVEEEKGLLPEFFFMYFVRAEMDRYGWFISDSSVRSNLDWVRFVEIQIPVPSPEKQRELVATWRGLRDMKEQNEAMAAPLMQLCQSRLQELKHKYPLTEIGPYIEQCDERNSENEYTQDDVRGISTDKKFLPTKANLEGVSLTSYKVVNPMDFAYVADTSRRGDKIALALNTTEDKILISSIYTTFKSKDLSQLLPEYLYLMMSRSEFDRYARFHSWGSARETFNWEDMCRVAIPLPPIEEQRAIVNIYKCAAECKRIAEEADRLSREICPALMQKAIRG
ncbi:MAG: restriction endonuclease subunit S [Bacteroidales bacterium]|nr:restriction endonuclease subunit S [Bacteroidales bacterium]